MIFLVLFLLIWAITSIVALYISFRKIFELMDYQQQTVYEVESIIKASQVFFDYSNTVEYMPEVIAWEKFIKESYKLLKDNLEQAGIPRIEQNKPSEEKNDR
jgi:hypothetical protein